MAHKKGGFSLLEVLVATTLLAITAGSCLGLISYHKGVRRRVENRFVLFNHASVLMRELPDIIAAQEPDFPYMEKDETERFYRGNDYQIKWQGHLVRIYIAGLPFLYRFTVKMSTNDVNTEFTNYMLPGVI